MVTATTNSLALDLWHASQTSLVQSFAFKLWAGDEAGAQDGIHDAILWALSRERWYDPTKGKLTTWLIMVLKSVRQRERSKGYRRGTVAEPRVVCPGAEAMPEPMDLCDPESILIARETAAEVLPVPAPVAKSTMPHAKLTMAEVAFIRASEQTGIELAKLFQVDRRIISNVRCGKTYRHYQQKEAA